jgi:thiol-disulfide isomerase/thioredoxin
MLTRITLIILALSFFPACESHKMKDLKAPETPADGPAQSVPPGAPSSGAPAGAPAGGLAAPDFTVPALDGGTCTLSAHKGKPVLLEFWSMGCGYCRKMIPELPKIAEALPGLAIVSVHSGRPGQEEQIKAQFPEKKFPVCLDDGSARKAYQSVPPPFRPGGIPHFILIDAQGQMRKAVVGYRDAAAMIAEIKASGIM